MSDTFIRLAVVTASLIAVLAIGLWTSRRQSPDDWMVAGRTLPLRVFVFGFVATLVSGFGFVGAPGLVYAYGWSVWIALISQVVAIPITYLVIAKPLWLISRDFDAPSIPDVLYVLFGSRVLRLMASLVIIVLSLGYMVVQWSAAARLGQGLLGLPYWQSLLIFVGIVGLYSSSGGSLASSYTDYLQGAIMFVAAIAITVVGLTTLGGLGGINETLANESQGLVELGNEGFPLGLVFSFFIIFGLLMGGYIPTTQRILFLRGTAELRWAALVCVVLYIVVSGFVWLAGIYTRVGVARGTLPAPDSPDLAIFTFMNNMLSVFITAVIYAAVIAAIMSTINAILILASMGIFHDIVSRALRTRPTPRRELLLLRLGSVFIVLVTVGASLNPPAFIGVLAAEIIGLFVASFFPVLVLGLRWRRATAQAGLASMVTGIGGGILLIALGSRGLQLPFLSGPAWGAVASSVVMVVGSLVTRHQPGRYELGRAFQGYTIPSRPRRHKADTLGESS